jgi:CheY-like chemotaxis protein
MPSKDAGNRARAYLAVKTNVKHRIPDTVKNPQAATALGDVREDKEDDSRPPVAVAMAILALTPDLATRDLLMELALERGFGLCAASDSAEAVRVLETHPPDLVVVDLDTAEGRGLLGILRAQDRWRTIPLYALTENNNPMATVTIDAPVFFKPELGGLVEAVVGRFESVEGSLSAELSQDLSSMAIWSRRTPSA